MKCMCDKNCIKTKEEILEDYKTRYESCDCCSSKKIKKSIPLKRQLKLDKIDANYLRCQKCNKRHIDTVMAHILKIMILNDQISDSASIRKVGTPLITPAVVLDRSPYLPNNSLVLITLNVNESVADKIYNEVPEVKAVVKGDINNTVGQLSQEVEINKYELLAGCDVRCDIQNTPTVPLCIYKPQSEIHIEYPKEKSQKIMDVDKVLDKYENPTVIDAMCGPGTLGIYALTKNAKKVLFNDIYDVAVETTKINLDINGISSEKYEIENLDINDLVENITQKYDVGLIDAFPGISVDGYVNVLKKICDEVIII